MHSLGLVSPHCKLEGLISQLFFTLFQVCQKSSSEESAQADGSPPPPPPAGRAE